MNSAKAAAGLASLMVLALAGCGASNPVFGDWEIDRVLTPPGAVLAIEAAALERLSFDGDSLSAGDTRIEGSYAIERTETSDAGEGQVRFLRADGRGEYRIELLPDDHIRIDLPIGVTGVYRRAG